MLIIFLLLTSHVFAVFYGYYGTEVYENSYISIEFEAVPILLIPPDAINITYENHQELYWSLLIWAVNSQGKLHDVTNSVRFFVRFGKCEKMIINENDETIVQSEFIFNDFQELQAAIFEILNNFYNIDVSYNDLHSIRLFELKYIMDDESYYSIGFFLTENSAKKHIEHDADDKYIIETRLFTKNEFMESVHIIVG